MIKNIFIFFFLVFGCFTQVIAQPFIKIEYCYDHNVTLPLMKIIAGQRSDSLCIFQITGITGPQATDLIQKGQPTEGDKKNKVNPDHFLRHDTLVLDCSKYINNLIKNSTVNLTYTISFQYKCNGKDIQISQPIVMIDASSKDTKKTTSRKRPNKLPSVSTRGTDCCNFDEEDVTYCNDPFYKILHKDAGSLTNKYDRQKVIYIYDFNKIPKRRAFYKIKTVKQSRHKIKKDYATDWYTSKIKTKKAYRYRLDTAMVNLSKETLNTNNSVQFQIANINRFMYNVSVNDTIVNFDSQPSSLFTQLFIGDTSVLGKLIKGFASINIPGSPSVQASGDTITQQTGQEDLASEIFIFLQKINRLQAQMLQAYNPCSSFSCCNTPAYDYDDVADDLDWIKIQIGSAQDTINKLNTQLKKKTDSLTTLAQAKKAVDTLPSAVKKVAAQLKPKDDSTQYKNLQAQQVKAKAIVDAYSPRKAQLSSDSADLAGQIKLFGSLASIQLPSDADIKKMVVFLNNMVAQNQTYEMDVPQLSGNRLDLKITIRTRDSIQKYFSIPEYYNDPISIHIPILWKGFVSFSSGSFAAVSSYLQNKTYAWQQLPGSNHVVTSSSNYVLVESGYTSPVAGFSAFGNFEWKITRSFGFGGTTGVGLTIESTPRLAYLAGGSLFFGDLRQFAVTGGIAAMQVSRLSNNWQAVADQQINYPSAPSLSYFKEIKIGGFVSISYTPFTTGKKNQ